MSNIIKINKNPDHIKNIHRINRIHGQLKGVEKMIVEKTILSRNFTTNKSYNFGNKISRK